MMSYSENLVRVKKPLGGEQRLYRFDNGYGASVVKFPGTLGFNHDLWELAVIFWYNDEDYQLVYTTDITDDVIGHLSEKDVEDILKRIKELE